MKIGNAQIERMIKYEDAEVLIVHKPPFLAVETKNPRQQDLVSLLKNRRVSLHEAAYIGLVHRLDQPVEGLLVLAKTPRAAEALTRELGGGGFAKEYLAVARFVTPEKGKLLHTLKRDGRTNTSAVVAAGTAGGKEARLSYERLAVAEEKSLLHIRLDTGKHHQIRVQLAAIGHPLCGDAKYGDGEAAGQPLALCSSRLAFSHPATGKRMEFVTKPAGAGFAVFEDAIDAWICRG